MLSILVVDDNPDKVRRILEVLRNVPGCGLDDIKVAYTAYDAKLLLREHEYDLLILDIALPERADTPATPNGGVTLLSEISTRPMYNKPRQIIGLTAYADVLVDANSAFAKELWHVIQYDPAGDGWAEQLQRKVKYLLLCSQNDVATSHDADLCVVTALPVPEFSALLDLEWNWTAIELPREVGTYRAGNFRSGDRKCKVVACCSPYMGMTAAAITATKAIYNFRPRYLAMIGIAAGIPGRCAIGDILVADSTWDYGSGKWSLDGSETLFEPAPHHIALNAVIRSRFQSMAEQQEIFDTIRKGWKAPKPNTTLKMIIGPLASGASVRADGEVAGEVQAQHRKTVGVEMEAYGVMAAAHEAPIPEVKGFVMKSVCDFADAKKGDDFQSYAAYTSASALKVFAESFLPV